MCFVVLSSVFFVVSVVSITEPKLLDSHLRYCLGYTQQVFVSEGKNSPLSRSSFRGLSPGFQSKGFPFLVYFVVGPILEVVSMHIFSLS